ncbi:MAG: MFS transporter, partial [Pseudomonadota bacterium]|nr:MFS transporter [Pseudomonadota bacterium]
MTTQTLPRTGMQSLMPILTIGLLFFIFGFVTWLNGALIPFLQMVCELSEMEALFIAFCFYVAYVVMALPMAKILEVTGYKKGMSLGLAMIAIGCLLFVPAALSKTFAVFLIAQFVVGSGLTILQTASNPFIVHLGSQDSAAARIAFMGLLNKFAGVLAPLLFTALVLGNFSDVSQVSLAQLPEAERAAQLNEMSSQLIQPYIGMAIALGILALGLLRVNLPYIQFECDDSNDSTQASGGLQFPHLVLGAITLFCYVGVEVIAGDTIGLYGSSLGVANATSLTSFTMTAMVIGYFLGLFCIPRLISQSKAMLLSGVLGLVFTVGIMLGSDQSHSISAILWGWTGIQTLPDTVA